jgi:hypothetical protein
LRLRDRLRAWRLAHAQLLRVALVVLLVVGLAPGTFVRSPAGGRGDDAEVTITPRPERAGVHGELRLSGVWEMRSPHGWFGGFSALTRGEGQALVAGTDRGFLLDIDLSGAAPRATARSFRFVGISTRGRKEYVDLESLARDQATGRLWGGFESGNLIVRFAPGGQRTVSAPPAMADWNENGGPEAMERLADGRFIVLAEDPEPKGWITQALVFPEDPVEGAVPMLSYLRVPEHFSPVDAAQLPDGRLLILLRRVRYTIPAQFDTAIAIADPRDIRPGGTWQARVIERLDGGIFADNFEGIAFVPSREDPARGSVWLVTDDNFSIFQRSLLIRFDWK